MGSEARLYTFSQDTKDDLRKFRLGTSRAKEPQAVVYHIDKNDYRILQDEPTETYKSLEDLAGALPENTPRYVLLSYPLTTKSGRPASPYILLSYLPATSTSEQRMLYAGARELMRAESQAGRLMDVDDEESVMDVGQKLASEAEE